MSADTTRCASMFSRRREYKDKLERQRAENIDF
jgi:hypothetical protein